MDFNENNDSSSDYQYVEDLEYIEELEYVEDDFCIFDIEAEKIGELTKIMNNFKLRLENFDSEPLDNISELKRNIYLLCEDNRYLIDDSKFLSNLESLIYKDISVYEDKLFMLSEQLVDSEINNKESDIKQKISNNKVINDHERLIYGEKIANERKLLREKANEKSYDYFDNLIKSSKESTYTKELEKENASERNYNKEKSNNKDNSIHYLIKLENQRKELVRLKELENNNFIRNYVPNDVKTQEFSKLENAKKLERDNDNVRNYINSIKEKNYDEDIISSPLCNQINDNNKEPRIKMMEDPLSEFSIKFYNHKNKKRKFRYTTNSRRFFNWCNIYEF